MDKKTIAYSRGIFAKGFRSQRDCPCCGYKNAFSVTVKEGKPLFYCHAGCSQADIWEIIHGHAPAREYHKINHEKSAHKDAAKFAEELWRKSLPADNTLVSVYLRARGPVFRTLPSSLRFLPSCIHKPSGTSWPAMIAAAMNAEGKVLAIHRTYITKDGNGKAPVQPAKMTLGAVNGLSCHLAEAGETLIISEGIETGLCMQIATGMPTWAALSAGGMRNLILPPLPLASEIIIAADNDANGCGQRAARDAAISWEKQGRTVRIALPPETGMDFNDVLLQGAAK